MAEHNADKYRVVVEATQYTFEVTADSLKALGDEAFRKARELYGELPFRVTGLAIVDHANLSMDLVKTVAGYDATVYTELNP